MLFVFSIGHDLLRDLFALETAEYCNFDLIAEKLKEQFYSKTNLIVEKFKFHNIQQAEFEQSLEFVMKLRKQAIN